MRTVVSFLWSELGPVLSIVFGMLAIAATWGERRGALKQIKEAVGKFEKFQADHTAQHAEIATRLALHGDDLSDLKKEFRADHRRIRTIEVRLAAANVVEAAEDPEEA